MMNEAMLEHYAADIALKFRPPDLLISVYMLDAREIEHDLESIVSGEGVHKEEVVGIGGRRKRAAAILGHDRSSEKKFRPNSNGDREVRHVKKNTRRQRMITKIEGAARELTGLTDNHEQLNQELEKFKLHMMRCRFENSQRKAEIRRFQSERDLQEENYQLGLEQLAETEREVAKHHEVYQKRVAAMCAKLGLVDAATQQQQQQLVNNDSTPAVPAPVPVPVPVPAAVPVTAAVVPAAAAAVVVSSSSPGMDTSEDVVVAVPGVVSDPAIIPAVVEPAASSAPVEAAPAAVAIALAATTPVESVVPAVEPVSAVTESIPATSATTTTTTTIPTTTITTNATATATGMDTSEDTYSGGILGMMQATPAPAPVVEQKPSTPAELALLAEQQGLADRILQAQQLREWRIQVYQELQLAAETYVGNGKDEKFVVELETELASASMLLASLEEKVNRQELVVTLATQSVASSSAATTTGLAVPVALPKSAKPMLAQTPGGSLHVKSAPNNDMETIQLDSEAVLPSVAVAPTGGGGMVLASTASVSVPANTTEKKQQLLDAGKNDSLPTAHLKINVPAVGGETLIPQPPQPQPQQQQTGEAPQISTIKQLVQLTREHVDMLGRLQRGIRLVSEQKVFLGERADEKLWEKDEYSHQIDRQNNKINEKLRQELAGLEQEMKKIKSDQTSVDELKKAATEENERLGKIEDTWARRVMERANGVNLADRQAKMSEDGLFELISELSTFRGCSQIFEQVSQKMSKSIVAADERRFSALVDELNDTTTEVSILQERLAERLTEVEVQHESTVAAINHTKNLEEQLQALQQQHEEHEAAQATIHAELRHLHVRRRDAQLKWVEVIESLGD